MYNTPERHEKTFIEKYGINSLSEEIDKYVVNNRELNEFELYKNLPCLGNLYIPINNKFRKLLPHNAILEGAFCPVKVTSVDEEEATIYEFDDNELWWNVKTFRHADYLIKGNQLALAPHYEAKLLLINEVK